MDDEAVVYLGGLLEQLIAKAERTNQLLEDLRLRSGGGNRPPQPDIALARVEWEVPGKGKLACLKLILNPPRKQVEGKWKSDYKARNERAGLLLGGLVRGKHYFIEEVPVLDPETNKQRTYPDGTGMTDKHYLFPLVYVRSLFERMNALGMGDLKIEGDADARKTIEAGDIPQEHLPEIRSAATQENAKLFAIGNQWAKTISPAYGDFKARRHALASEVLGRAIESFTTLAPAEVDKLIVAMQQQIDEHSANSRRLAQEYERPADMPHAAPPAPTPPAEPPKPVDYKKLFEYAWKQYKLVAEDINLILAGIPDARRSRETISFAVVSYAEGMPESVEEVQLWASRAFEFIELNGISVSLIVQDKYDVMPHAKRAELYTHLFETFNSVEVR